MNAPLTFEFRMALAGLVGLTGVFASLVVLPMLGFPDQNLPDQSTFHKGAAIGASSIGFLFAGGFGRRGVSGVALALLSALFATFLGAEVGSLYAQHTSSAFELTLQPGLGALLILLNVTSPVFVTLWVSSFIGIHVVASAMRQFNP